MTFFQDTFTESSNTDLPNHTPDVGTGWSELFRAPNTSGPTLQAASTDVCQSSGNAANQGCAYVANATYPSADYSVEVTLVATQSQSTRPVYILARVQDAENMYAARIVGNNSQIYKKVSGTWTALGSTFALPTVGSVIRFEVVESSLEVFDDDVSVASATDSDISAAGQGGLAVGGGDELVDSTDDQASGWQFDDFTLTDLGAATGEYELIAQQGSFSQTGQAAALLANRLLSGVAGAFTLSGQTVALVADRNISAVHGNYESNGQTLGLGANRVISAENGAYVATGQAGQLIAGRLFTAAQGAYESTGQAVIVLVGRTLPATAGAYTLSGQEVQLIYTPAAGEYVLLAEQGAYVLEGKAAQLLVGRRLQADQGAYTLSCADVIFVVMRALLAQAGVYQLDGQPVTFVYSEVELPEARIYVVEAERRIYVVPAMDNTYIVEADNRTFIVPVVENELGV